MRGSAQRTSSCPADVNRGWRSIHGSEVLIKGSTRREAGWPGPDEINSRVMDWAVMVKGEAVGMVSARDFLTFQGIQPSQPQQRLLRADRP